jgi:Tfp pilus assembly major pilin PilA
MKTLKNLMIAAVAALSLSAVVIPAYAHSTVAGDAAATQMQRTGQL